MGILQINVNASYFYHYACVAVLTSVRTHFSLPHCESYRPASCLHGGTMPRGTDGPVLSTIPYGRRLFRSWGSAFTNSPAPNLPARGAFTTCASVSRRHILEGELLGMAPTTQINIKWGYWLGNKWVSTPWSTFQVLPGNDCKTHDHNLLSMKKNLWKDGVQTVQAVLWWKGDFKIRFKKLSRFPVTVFSLSHRQPQALPPPQPPPPAKAPVTASGTFIRLMLNGVFQSGARCEEQDANKPRSHQRPAI